MAQIILSRIFKVVKPVKVTITGTGNSISCYVTVNGGNYAAAASGIEVLAGDTITMAVKSSMPIYNSTIKVNGATVATATRGQSASYEYTVPEGITSVNIALAYSTNNGSSITLTTA